MLRPPDAAFGTDLVAGGPRLVTPRPYPRNMARFECERCGGRKTARVLYGYPTPETYETYKDRDDVVLGGCVTEVNSPNRLCIICGWPGDDNWNAFDGPRSA